MSLSQLGVIVVLALCVSSSSAQFPFPNGFMSGFHQGMASMVNNLNTMSQNLATMGQNMQAQHSAQMEKVRAATANLEPGQRRYFNNGNSRGFAYRSPDGGFTSYSFTSGSPGGGYMFYSGPDGTYQRSW